MTQRGIICAEEPQVCEMCGIIAECRPYGPNYEEICFDCGQKHPETTQKRMEEYIFGALND